MYVALFDIFNYINRRKCSLAHLHFPSSSSSSLDFPRFSPERADERSQATPSGDSANQTDRRFSITSLFKRNRWVRTGTVITIVLLYLITMPQSIFVPKTALYKPVNPAMTGSENWRNYIRKHRTLFRGAKILTSRMRTIC